MKISLALVLVAGLSCVNVQAQSLAEASAAAKQIHHEWPSINSVPVYTNVALAVTPAAAEAVPVVETLAPALAVKDGAAYWRGRMAPLRAQLDADQLQMDAAAAKAAEPAIRAMTIADLLHDPGGKNLKSNISGGPLLVDRTADKLQADTALATLTVAVAADRAAIVRLEEEARVAGAIPGWLR